MTLLALALLPALSTALPDAEHQPDRPPNIVFILADDLGYGDLGCYGQTGFATPRIDQLAAEGSRFTDFYAGCTVCAPSRCVLMTGRHTGHAFIRGNGKDNLRPEDVTVAEVLKRAGYATALCGKWGLGHEDSTGLPTRQGFDHFFGYLDQHHAHNYYPTFLILEEARYPLPNVVPKEGRWGQGVASERKAYSHDLIAEDALAWIDEHHSAHPDQPFFLYLSLTLPHANNEAGRAGMEVPDLGAYADKDWPVPKKGFVAMVQRLDRDVGRLVDLIDSLGLTDDTLILFSSDNGPHAEGGNDPNWFDSNGPLQGIKRSMHEGGIRVPLIARWPGTTPAGETSDHVGGFQDLLATAADLGGVEADCEHDGVSFAPTLRDDGSPQPEHDYLYWEFYEQGSRQAVRQGQWKAIRQPMFDGPVQLYDLSKDLGEEHDLAQDEPEITKRMAALMDAAHEPSERWRVKGRK